MKRALLIVSTGLALAGLALGSGCGGIKSGATVTLSGISLGSVMMEGRTVTGLPSDKVNMVLNVAAQKVDIKYTPDGSIITLAPSGATIEIKATGVSVKGVKAEETTIEWVK